MCGICGFLTKEAVSLELLHKMNDKMYHRGPNDSGAFLSQIGNDYALGMAQRRLSIQDLSELGHQPMHSPDDKVIVVFNGEIYNYSSLRKECSGYPFSSHCDTEVILAVYLKWGKEGLKRLKGMFAIALYDRESGELILMRDRIGKKPLYYWYERGNLYFASELKPILAIPFFRGCIRKDILKQYLHQKYIHAPATVFENVYKLEPGAMLTVSAAVKDWEVLPHVDKYWSIREACLQGKNSPVTDYSQAKEELKELLKSAVTSRMISDVPLGTFLSGGYDSSLITAMAQEASGEPVKTFSIGFHDKKYDEAGYARQVADCLGTDHTEQYIAEEDMLALVESIPAYYDEPFADSSQIPMMLVSGLAAEKVTVALSGDGGDEFFCGYHVYELLKKAQKLDPAGAVIHGVLDLPGIRGLDLERKLPFSVRAIASNRNPQLKTQFGSDYYWNVIGSLLPSAGGEPGFAFDGAYGEKNWQIRRMLLDMETYLPGDILCKVDRASMKYSLEARCPILDVDVMEYSFRLPHSYKSRGGIQKAILKDIAYDYLPKELLDRKKSGFAVPLDKWLRGPLRSRLTDYCEVDFVKSQGLFDEKALTSFVGDYLKNGDMGAHTGRNASRLVWAYFVFQQWYEHYRKAGCL